MQSELQEIQEYARAHPDDKEFHDVLAQLNQVLDDNPLQGFHPLYQEQKDYLAAEEMIVLFAAGNQAGKTTVSIIGDLIQAVDKDCLPDRLKPYKTYEPPFLCRIISPDFTSTMEGAIFETIREWCPKDQLVGGSWDKAYSKQRRVLNFKNGSWFQFLTFEQDRDKHGGVRLDRAHFDEEPPGEKGRAIYHENLRGVMRRGGDIRFSLTPLHGCAWLHDDIYEKRFESHIKVIHADIDQNTTLDEATKQAFLASLTKEELKARKEGKFVYFEGLVYSELQKDRHVVDPPSPEHVRSLTTVVTIDPGIEKTGVLWTGFDSENVALVYDELYLSDSTVEATAEAIKAKNAEWGVKPDYYVIDPTARNRTLVNAEQVEGEFTRCGIYCCYGQNALETGVFQVKRRLQADPPAVLISRVCEWLLWEFARYRYSPKADGKFDVVRRDNHLMDCLRYACMHMVWGAEMRALKNHERPRYQVKVGESIPWHQFPTQKQGSPPMGAMS